MWEGVRDRMTEAVFRIEEMGDEEAQAALWAGARERTQAAISAQQARQAQDAESRDADERRRRGEEGRADPQHRPEGRPQRPVPVRQREEVQELPHEDGRQRKAVKPQVRGSEPNCAYRSGRNPWIRSPHTFHLHGPFFSVTHTAGKRTVGST